MTVTWANATAGYFHVTTAQEKEAEALRAEAERLRAKVGKLMAELEWLRTTAWIRRRYARRIYRHGKKRR